MHPRLVFLFFLGLIVLPALWCFVEGEQDLKDPSLPEKELRANEKVGSKTDHEVIEREEEAINPDGFSVKEQKMIEQKAQKLQFQAEVDKLMNIIINSLYSNPEVFLRELISNASDALDKIRFLSVTDSSQLGENTKLEIKIKADKEAKTLTIQDTGIGMTKQELITNLGTIAKSGTTEFLEKIKQSPGDASMIGQFGVGFYSAFLAADTVTVISKNNADDQYVWKSDASGSFTVAQDPRGNTLGRGTQIILHVKEEAEEFLEEATLRNLVKKYSEFINFPIYLWTAKEEEKEVPLTEEELKAQEEEEDTEQVDLEEEELEERETKESEKPKTKTVKETVYNWELMNETKPIWTRNSKDLTDEDYNNFYKSFTKDTADPLARIHFNGEGEVEFKALLYIPSSPPNNMFDPRFSDDLKAIKLYVKRVFITDEFKDLLPKYLQFIRGIVDSDDLPFNVSREMLQENKILKVIKKKLVRKAIAMIQSLSEDKEKFKTFWKNYATNIKLGVIEDTHNRPRLSKLLMFYSSKTGDLTTLDDYVSRMKENQTQIYYLAGESKENVEKSPLLEKLIKKGYEVLYMVDPIDEYCTTHMEKFDGKYKLANIAREGLKFDGEDENEEQDKEKQEQFAPLLKFLKKVLGSKIEKAVVSKRLSKSPSALVAGTYGWTANMERIVKAQTLADPSAHAFNAPKKVMEVNPAHPIVKELERRVEADENDPTANDIANLMYDTAALSSGFSLDNPSDFASRIVKMINLSLDLDANAQAEEEPEPEPSQAASEEQQEEKTSTKDEL